MNAVGWFQIAVGSAVLALWSLLLLMGSVPEVQEGRTDIWFHVVAEAAMAGLLLAGGVSLFRRTKRVRLLSALALGALAYSAVNSSGYYAEAGEWAPVSGFAVVVVAAVASFVVLRTHRSDHPSGALPAVEPRLRSRHRG